MAIQESGEMYLEAIHVLTEKNKYVRSIDVAHHTGYSKPSISRAMSILKKDEYITIDEDGYIYLTSKGQEVAERIYERHTILTDFFISIGVNEEVASQDACRIEHVISDETFERIKLFKK